MKACGLRQDEEHSHNPVCQLQFVSKLSTGNSSENPHVCFCKDNLILILHTNITAQQPPAIVCISMGETQRERGESWSQLWTHSPESHRTQPRQWSSVLSQGKATALPSPTSFSQHPIQSLRFPALPLLPWLWSRTANSVLKTHLFCFLTHLSLLTAHQTLTHIKQFGCATTPIHKDTLLQFSTAAMKKAQSFSQIRNKLLGFCLFLLIIPNFLKQQVYGQ